MTMLLLVMAVLVLALEFIFKFTSGDSAGNGANEAVAVLLATHVACYAATDGAEQAAVALLRLVGVRRAVLGMLATAVRSVRVGRVRRAVVGALLGELVRGLRLVAGVGVVVATEMPMSASRCLVK